MPKTPKPKHTPEELAEIVWNYGDNFPMRKVRGRQSYQKVPKEISSVFWINVRRVSDWRL